AECTSSRAMMASGRKRPRCWMTADLRNRLVLRNGSARSAKVTAPMAAITPSRYPYSISALLLPVCVCHHAHHQAQQDGKRERMLRNDNGGDRIRPQRGP